MWAWEVMLQVAGEAAGILLFVLAVIVAYVFTDPTARRRRQRRRHRKAKALRRAWGR